ncbi:heavy metal-binding domain-containing protein [Aureispira sp. CCB-QB1]|uniref:heavy metal-binding domain-containing protein n=1 Tax=Aureispira sp. CCB-QB1 TaxID=1313421 RepID=UPI000696AC46|nr:heavy metal-binding domain-containing protein [Aureispira sp. CCB-QB1]
MKSIYGIIALLFVVITLVSCSVNVESDDKKESTEQQGKEYTAAYICPMHCEGSGSDEMGTCPVCGMDYEKNEKHNESGHSH